MALYPLLSSVSTHVMYVYYLKSVDRDIFNLNAVFAYHINVGDSHAYFLLYNGCCTWVVMVSPEVFLVYNKVLKLFNNNNKNNNNNNNSLYFQRVTHLAKKKLIFQRPSINYRQKRIQV